MRLGRHIEGQFRLIAHVFTASLIVSVSLLSYGLKALSGSTSVPGPGPFLLLAPLVIAVPCAYLIRSLREEIFKWATYIRVYLEDNVEWQYETELTKYRGRFPESESLSPIAATYWCLFGLCSVCFGWALHEDSMALCWLLLLLVPFGLLLYWQMRYQDIPHGYSATCEKNWSEIRRGGQ